MRVKGSSIRRADFEFDMGMCSSRLCDRVEGYSYTCGQRISLSTLRNTGLSSFFFAIRKTKVNVSREDSKSSLRIKKNAVGQELFNEMHIKPRCCFPPVEKLVGLLKNKKERRRLHGAPNLSLLLL